MVSSCRAGRASCRWQWGTGGPGDPNCGRKWRLIQGGEPCRPSPKRHRSLGRWDVKRIQLQRVNVHYIPTRHWVGETGRKNTQTIPTSRGTHTGQYNMKVVVQTVQQSTRPRINGDGEEWLAHPPRIALQWQIGEELMLRREVPLKEQDGAYISSQIGCQKYCHNVLETTVKKVTISTRVLGAHWGTILSC